jgi:AsmA protein
MGRLFKYLGWLIGLVVLLVVAAVVVLPMVVDPNDFKGQIISRVEQETGRSLKIDGDLKLSVFPWLGIEIAGLELGNARGFGPEPFAMVKRAAVRVKLMPLLSRQLEVDTVGLDGLVLNLSQAKDGRSNWADLEQRGEAPASEPAGDSGGEKSAGGLSSLAIGGVNISDAKVSWDDRRSGQQFIIDRFNLKSGVIAIDRPVDLQVAFRLESSEPPLEAEIDMAGQVTLDQPAERLAIKGLQLKLVAQGEALPAGKAEAELASDVSLTLDGRLLEVRELQLRSGELQLSGDLKGQDLNTSPTFSGNFRLAEFDLRQWLIDQGVQVPVTADPAVLTRFSAQAVLKVKAGATRIESLEMQLDDTRLSGSVKLQGAAVGFNLKLDEIDLDRYLPPQKEPKEAKPKTASSPAVAGGTGKDEALMPVETLRQLNLDGVLSIGQVKIMKLLAEQIDLTVKAKDGRLTLDKQIKKFYEGSYKSSLGLDVRGKAPLIKVDTVGSGIAIGPLLKEISGEDRLTGKGRFDAKLNTRGNSIESIKAALGGRLAFRFEDGAVKGFNLARTIREAKARLKGKPLPVSDEPVQTDFSEISGSAVIRKGVLDNRDLLAKSPYLRVTGAGKVNLVQETLDYTAKVVIVHTAKGTGGKDLKELEGIPIPIHLTGSYLSPSLDIEWGEVLTETQKARLEKKKEKYQQKLEKKLEKKLFKLFN